MKEKIQRGVQSVTHNFRRKYVGLADRLDLMASRSLDIKDCESVCLTLGPYRNLTTLTAATLFLHPNCQVLNHAGTRIYGNKQVDFLSDFSEEKLDRFVRFAIKISGKGQYGGLGGSITYSHAFDRRSKMKETYADTGSELTKKQIKCLFWKESLLTSNLIREKQVDLRSIFEKDGRVRFLLPIRNPIDCAISNLKTGHVRQFRGLSTDSSVFEAVQAILDEIHWFASYEENRPDRFFHYSAHAISRQMLVDLATFLALDPDESWLSNALSVMVTRPSYEHDRELLAFYRDAVADKFSQFPAFAEELLAFT